MVHLWLGLLAAIFNLLVHCCIFTYFLGMGRRVKEVAIAYQMPDEPLPKLTLELKRHSRPPCSACSLRSLRLSIRAAARVGDWPWQVHLALALLTLVINAWAFGVEYRDVSINATVIEGVMAEVDRIRAERGLASNADALQQEAR